MRTVHVVVPDGIDDPARPSGGNTYDRRVCGALRALGWTVVEHPVSGAWPQPDSVALAALETIVERIADGAVVLIDGLIASAAPEPLVAAARRQRLVVLVHMPLGLEATDDDVRARERAVLSAAAAVVATSDWTRRRLLKLYDLPGDRVHVARPGVDAADLAPGTEAPRTEAPGTEAPGTEAPRTEAPRTEGPASAPTGTAAGGALVCVAAVTFDKGHDLLLAALAQIASLSFTCTCVGSLERAPAFVAQLRARARDSGLADRVRLIGPRTGTELAASYAAADLLVLPSRSETYGMVVTEALARGLPVVAADVGGVSEALGYGAGQVRPGLLVPAGDAGALAAALESWLVDVELRARLRRAACERRESLQPWSTTASALERALTGERGDGRR